MKKIKSYDQFLNEDTAWWQDFGNEFTNMLNGYKPKDPGGPESFKGPLYNTYKGDAAKSIDPNGKKFVIMDLNTADGYNAYALICQKWIDKRNPSSPIKGDMLAHGAKLALNKYGSFIPPQLALAQMTVEGGLGTDPNSKPIRTKNPFNVGNVDSGGTVTHPDWQDGIDAYYELMGKSYVVPARGKTADSLLNKFVNVDNQRYAAGADYEKDVTAMVNSINQKLQAA